MEKRYDFRCQKLHEQSVIGMESKEQFCRSDGTINTIGLTQFFYLVRRSFDIVSTHFTKQDFPLLKEGLGFWVGRRTDGIIESTNAVLSELGISTEVTR